MSGEPRVERRLAAIVAADVAGYSRLTGLDEEGTLARLKVLRHELIDPAIASARGRVVKTMGDGFLIEFPSVVDAVRCAVEVQRGVGPRNAAFAPEQRIEFRVGIHVGDVVVEGDDLLGDGVNVAARLEGLSESGGIALSEDAFRQVQGKVSAEFVDAGEQALKNIARPMRVYRVALGDGASLDRPVLPLPDKPSIAVLPFQNMSGDPEQEYFCDGVVEEIVTALSRFGWLFVIARNSSFTYKGRTADVKQVGRDLGVRYVLEGSVRKAGNRVRITGQLIEATTGTQLWAQRYDRSLDDIFAVQDEIVAAIVGTLVPEIGAAESARALRETPQNLVAWDIYQRGLHRFYRFGKDDLIAAQTLFDRAILLDRASPDPYVFRALAGTAAVMLGYAASPRDVLSETARFAQQALQLDERNALAHTLLGRTLMLAGRHEAAIAENRLAVELNPNLALAHFGLGMALMWVGQAEPSVACFEQALRLSPRDPLSPIWRNVMGLALTFTGADEAAFAAIDAALRQRPDNATFMALRALPLVGLGRLDEARASVDEALARSPNLSLAVVMQSSPNLCGAYLEIALDRLAQAGMPE
jgi:adenylate cyclase